MQLCRMDKQNIISPHHSHVVGAAYVFVLMFAPTAAQTLPVKVIARFRVNYSTKWGENLVILGSTEELGGLVNPSESEARKAIATGKGKVGCRNLVAKAP
jgi:hypothetical protein